jgi:hypothetical protein
MENKNKTNKDFMGFWAAGADQENIMINYFIFDLFLLFSRKAGKILFQFVPKKKVIKSFHFVTIFHKILFIFDGKFRCQLT